MKKTGANKMGSMPVNKLLISMSLPMMISMLIQALYNVVDSIFVAKICEDALTAVSMAFSMQTLIVAAAGGIGVGINALLSRSLGEKNRKMASLAATSGLLLGLIAYIIFLLIGLFAVKPFYVFQTGDVSSPITQYGVEYLTCILVCSLGMFAQMLFERLLISTGRTFYSMITQTLGAIINIIFDPILIFGLCGFPKMGVLGAALATVLGQWVAAILACIFNIKLNHDISINFKKFRPDAGAIKTILAVGVPSMIMQAIGSVMTFSLNKILIWFSSTAVAVFGVYFKINSIVFMPVFGLNNGMVPIVAYNYGAQNRTRMMSTVKYSVIYAVSLMLLGALVIEWIPDKLLLMFDASEHMLSIGVPALRIVCVCFPFAGCAIVLSSLFQALGHSVYSMMVSLVRQLFVLLPSAFVLALIGKAMGNNVTYVWWSFLVAEAFAISMSLFFYKRLYKKEISKIPVGVDS
ncbi:MAG: MATE family efflux transporter [Clostridiales bacterium]|nr:MATE family efflux transporter [Clostridiales bacterium]